MNLQFSLSMNAVSDNAGGISHHSEALANQDSQQIQAVKSQAELTRLEREGLPISMGDEQLIKAIDKAVKALQGPTTTLEMSVHEKTHQILVKVLNKDTGELIREIPPEKTLDLVAKMMEIAGILIDEKI
ncbi:flagellar protein FlaG [Paenibacillus farraposensis]|uniref:Flagellar protein FlaG n=1 Tax=Paenibacillus farraposensis TaxID=2807095 RepID=A0ABW4DCG2_9BACL|nr:flagellar protein FlaG [Paenibacillus farraposensis]MCC3379493.1 flagellar protein FlaG [Paenibacillus farraposensis]